MALSAAESSGGPGAGPRDLEPLDAYIQNTLSAFYLPFEATAATVLWQLFSVAETLHSGDGLRCLTHFLIPAKKALQRLQQEACARYTGLVFLHPGWPLCIHEKVVVQLASLHQVRLRPGDFYLQVTSAERQSARLVLKCLSPLGNTEEVTVPEAMYGCVFTGEFLQQVNAGRGCVPLQNCLLTSGSAVHRTPWSSVTDPVFLPTGAILQTCPSHVGPEKSLLGSTSKVPGTARAMASSTTLPYHHGHLGCEQPRHPPYLRRADLDGPRTLYKTADRGVMKGRQESPESNGGLDPTDQDSPHPTCPGDLSSPQARRRLVGDRARAEARRWFRKSYMEALRNPMPLGSSSEESLTGNKDLKAGTMTSLTQRESPDTTGSPQHTLSKEKTVALRWTCSGTSGRTRPRRSQSWDRSLRSSQREEPAAHRTSHHAVSRRSGGLLGGHAVGTRNVCSVSPSHVAAAAPTCTREEAVLPTPAFIPGREPSRCPDVTAELLCSECEGRPPSQGPQQVLDTNQELLQSGVITLPGTRDRHGRAVVQVCTRGPLWSSKHSSHAELSCLLMYLCGIPRKEVRDLGLLVLVDARRSPVSPALSWALSGLQNTSPPIIHSVLLLVDKESAFSPDRGTTIQCEVVSSLKALHKLVDSSQLTADLDGSFPYSHRDWICFRMKLEAFTADCKEAIVFLQNSVRSLDTHRVQRTSQEVTEAITQHEKMMQLVLEDALLVWLRLEGSVVLARLRREGLGAGQDCQDAVEAASRLYNQVDEEVHRLVLASNRGLQRLENLRELRTLEERHDQIERWFEEELEKFLGPWELLSYEDVEQRQQELQALLASVTRYCQKGLQLVKENSQNSQETTQGFQRRLSAMVGRAECLEGELACWTHLSTLYETVNRWLLRCTKYLEHVVPEVCPSSPVTEYLKSCHQEATKMTAEAFHRASGTVLGLGGQQALQRWRDLWLRYQQMQLRLEEALAGANLGPGMLTVDQSPPKLKLAQEATWKHREPPTRSPAKADGSAGEWARGPCSLTGQAILCGWEGQGLCGPWAVPPSLGVPVGPGASMTDTDSSSTCSSYPTSTPAGHPRKHPLKKMMKKIPGFEMPQLDSGPRDACQLGHTGVFIRGLEVTGTVPRLPTGCPPGPRSRSLSSPSRTQPPEEVGGQHTGSRLQHIVAEMISTEQEYVRSLGYVVDNYFPEMERMDLPQDLRGKRSVVFGNLEKLHDFHQQYFLQELERCRHCPLAVGRGFLRHEEEFRMYALYSKNKPQSDALLSSHGNAFFKDKQQELGDKMDLASYLLKPVQRMGKYVLLLQDLVKEASRCPGREQELGELQAAEEVVRFQLRHGNDLLAMDAVRGCDVDLKEQGQLRCQDEFLVCCGRRKYLRRVFLFEDLILFSKTKKVDGGYDLYLYKQSFKTAEIGLTENVGDSGLRFEIWFRRRRKPQDTYVLQASSVEVKRAWTEVIGKILWRQALRNRELRMREVASMGMGSKPFLDIQPSEAAISDRAIDYIMKETVPQTRASIAVSSFDHATCVKRPHSTISESSSSSGSQASSFLGPPNLHVSTSPALGPWPSDIRTCIEEDELEQEASSQTSVLPKNSELTGDSASGLGYTVHPGPSCLQQLLCDACPPLPVRSSQLQLGGGQATTAVAQQGLDSVAHNLYPLLFKASYLQEQAEVVCAVLGHWPLEEFRLGALLGPSADHPEDLRDRACRACLEACVRGLASHVLQGGRRRLRLADLTGVRDVQVQRCPCRRALGRWGRTELLARTCCELQAGPPVAGRPIEVLADLFVTEGNFEAVVQALRPVGPAPLLVRCPSFRADSLSPGQLLHVLRLAGPGTLRKLEVVHNVRLHAGHVQQLLAQVGFPQLASLTLPTKAFDMPPTCAPTPGSEDSLLTSIARELGRMAYLTELSVAFSTLTGKIPTLLSSLRTPLRTLDLANCALNHADMAYLADCVHAAHLEVLDLSGHNLVHLFPSTFFRLLGQTAQTLRVLTLEDCSIADNHVGMMILGLSPCRRLQEFRFLGNPLSARALRRLFTALCELPRLRRIEFPVPRDCYPEDAAYPQDELGLARFDQQKYDLIAEELRVVLLQAHREDIQASTPLYGSFDPDIEETSNELSAFLLQAFKTALENFSRTLRQTE